MASSNISDDSAAATCEQCKKHALFRCARCQNSHYCSTECQEKAWPNHKTVCLRAIKEATSGPVASQTAAILFHEDHFAPVHVHLRHSLVHPLGYPRVDLGISIAITGEEEDQCRCVVPGWFDVTKDGANDVDLDHTIRVHYRDDFRVYDTEVDKELEEGRDGMSVNKALLTSLGTNGNTHIWKGPVIAYGIKDFYPDSTPKTIVDLDADDARHIINFMREIQDPIQMTLCVRVNCAGDVQYGHPKYEVITLPAFHGIFQQNATPISTRMELPITVARIPESVKTWESRDRTRGHVYINNEAAALLNMGCDEDYSTAVKWTQGGYGWGSAPRTWDYPQGSCIVARKDKMPLHPDYAAALAEYCYDDLPLMFQMVSSGKYEQDGQHSVWSKQQVLDAITKDKFKDFFQTWKARRDHPEMHPRVSRPYDI